MNTRKYFNEDFLADMLRSAYAKQARKYQYEFNSSHPGHHIWRHGYRQQSYVFFINGKRIAVSFEIIRFIYADTGKTFTYLGSLFLRYIRYACQFVRYVLHYPDAAPADELPVSQVMRWNKLQPLLHNPPSPPPPACAP